MGRRRENRRVVTYSLAKMTIDRIEELREWKQKKYWQVRSQRVTFSEIIDDAIREKNERTFAFDEEKDPTRGGRWNPDWVDTEKWQCPYCRTDADPVLNVGGHLFCPWSECGKPRPEASYPEGV